MSQTVVDILHNCRLFSDIEARGFQQLAAIARIRRFRKGQTIFREGDECPGAYVVGSGLVRVFKTGAGGKEHVLHMVGPGNTFAEVAAIGGFHCPANADAVAATTAALLPTDPFRQALQENHQLCLGMITGLALSVRRLVQLMEDIVLRDAVGRLARFLLESTPAPDGTVELPWLKRYVASHLNLTSETVSRVFRRLVEAGLITELEDNRTRLLHPEKLRQVAKGLFPEA
jgi:CRP/FNR family transcriptional regulator